MRSDVICPFLASLVDMIETLSWELHQIGVQRNGTKSKMFITEQLDHPMYVEVSHDLVHVFMKGLPTSIFKDVEIVGANSNIALATFDSQCMR